MQDERHDRRVAGFLDHLERNERLPDVGEGLGDDVVDTRVRGPADLLLEHRSHHATRLLVVREQVRVADVAGEERAALRRDLLRDRESLAVERFEQVLLADDSHLLAVRVVGERLDHVGAGMNEVSVQLRHDLRMVEHDLGHERARLEVSPALELEEVTLRADDRALLEPFQETATHVLHHCSPDCTSERTGSRSGGTVSPSPVNGTCSRTRSCARFVPLPSLAGPRRSTA